MMPDSFIKKEIIEDIKNKRAFVIKMILPVLLISPLAFSSVSDEVKTGILLAFAIFFGVFGSAVAFVRFKESGMMERISVLPIASWKLTLDYILANVFLDIIQLLIPFVLVLLTMPHNLTMYLLSPAALLAIIIVSNSVGVSVAFIAKTSAEVHLYSIIALLLLVFLSGAIKMFNIPVIISRIFPYFAFFHVLTQNGQINSLYILINLLISCLIWLAVPMVFSKRNLTKKF